MLLRCTALILVGFISTCSFAEHQTQALQALNPKSSTPENAVIEWNNAALEAVRESRLGPPMVARALAIVHTCIYDAWAAYDARALGTQLGERLRRPLAERTEANKEKALSFAAYRALVDLFPAYRYTIFDVVMEERGYDASDISLDSSTPAGIGNLSCSAVLKFRHHDGSNQLADLTPGRAPYSDWTGWTALNHPSTVPVRLSTVSNPDHWQPLAYPSKFGVTTSQLFVGAQWFRVQPFAMTSPSQFRHLAANFGPPKYGTKAFLDENLELVAMSASLTDKQKMIAEYWADGPNSELPPGHWDLFAQFVSQRDQHSLDDDVKMFFALTNAIFDASIAAWDAKRADDSVRPATAIPVLFAGEKINSWGGPGKGTVEMDGSKWLPYQPDWFPTPPFPEFVSGHSAFSFAGAEVLRRWTGSDAFGYSTSFAPGSSRTEPGFAPKTRVTLSWKTFSEAAAQAGISRRYGGIHFRPGDFAGRAVGKAAGKQALEKAQMYWSGKGPRISGGLKWNSR